MLSNPRFFSRILLPSMVAVLVFLVAIYLLVIPNYRESLMNGKRETIRELTSSAWSVMHKLDLMVNNNFNEENAKREAALIISDMRWGHELKDYFWITDTTPRMIMHPYRPAMNGMDLSDYKDQRGKNFFVDIVNLVNRHGDGYIDYKWQWKDDSLTVVSKLSYVKAYEPWGWIVGTGIYIDDVNREIEALTQRVVWISAFITLIIGAIITYLARRNYIAESERQLAQENLKDSMERYKKLVEATTDGVLMMMDGEIVYCNPYLLNLLGYSQQEFDQHDSQFHSTLTQFLQPFTLSGNEADEHQEISVEQMIRKKNGVMVEVVVTRSKFEMEGKSGHIFSVKDVSKHKDVERELDLSMEKFKSIAGLMNIGVFRCTLGRQARFVEINPKAISLLGYKAKSDLNDVKVQDLFEINEEKKEVINAINEGITIKDRLLKIRKADGSILPTLVSLFPVVDAHGKMVYCDGMLVDAYDHHCHDTNFEGSPSNLNLSANILLRPVKDFLQPAPICNMKTTVGIASKVLTQSQSDILLIEDESGALVGLVTHSDISRRLISEGKNTSTPIYEIMSAPIISVSIEDMVMDAFALMLQHRVSYVVVNANGNTASSYISLLSLSELRKDTPEFLINTIQKANSLYEIETVTKQLPRIIQNIISAGTGVSVTGKLISKITDAVTEKLIEQAIDELGTPPVSFVFIALGSEGRREQTLATDQDNAIVYSTENDELEQHYKDYFLQLGKIVCTSLSKVGYPLCKGGVMAMSNEWCMSINEWQEKVLAWVSTPNPQEILNISIFFDFRPVYGDFELANQLQRYCQISLKNKDLFYYNLAQQTTNLKVYNVYGNKNSEIYDLKMPILAITSIARLWSLKYGISDKNTLERLLTLNTLGVLTSVQRQEFEQGYRILVLLRIKNQINQIQANFEPNNKVGVGLLSEMDKLTIKKIISSINAHLDRIRIDFRIA